MAYAIANRVFETSTSTGTGSFNLAGSTTGFQTFVAGIGDGNTCNYFISNDTDWEAGIGTITAGSPDVLSRDTVLESSNADAKVNWGSGTKNVYIPFLAQNTVVTNKNNTFNGTNAFSNPVTVATATDPSHAVTKAQLDANTPPDASATVKGIVELATVAEAEAGTDTTRAVTPEGVAAAIGANVNSEQLAKAWVNFDGTGTVSIRDSYNVSSITDNGVGNYTINFTNSFSNANYTAVMGAGSDTTLTGVFDAMGGEFLSAPTVSAFRIRTTNNDSFADLSRVYAAFFGDM